MAAALAVNSGSTAASDDDSLENSASKTGVIKDKQFRTAPLVHPLTQLLKRPEIVIEDLAGLIAESYPEFFAEIAGSAAEGGHAPNNLISVPGRLSAAARNEMKTVETEIKYAGYLDQQRKSIDRLKKAEQRMIPDWFDYGKVSGLSREMNEKLQRVRPRTLGHASRIPGVTPAAVSLINVYIEIQGKTNLAADTR